jgi:hypothetical protein
MVKFSFGVGEGECLVMVLSAKIPRIKRKFVRDNKSQITAQLQFVQRNLFIQFLST